MTTTAPEIQLIVDAVRQRQRFVLSSHSRPDGDAIGSQLAMAYALRAMGKEATVVNARTLAGEIGIMANHMPVLSVLEPGSVDVRTVDDGHWVAAVDGGSSHQ